MTTRDPRNPEQEKVNRGRRRKTYQTREETKKETTPSEIEQKKPPRAVLSDDQRSFEKEKSETTEKEV